MPLPSPPLLDRPAGGRHLVPLDADHPGFRDPAYRARRDAIARVAIEHGGEGPAPRIEYDPAEHATWATILATLAPLHARLVAKPLIELARRLDLPLLELPQLAEVGARTEDATGFRLVPVAGLATPRRFLEELGEGRFLCTQYLRHHERPLYTPEPDVVHELVGHAATLLDRRLAELLRRFGRAAVRASDERADELTRVFWHALEFGAVREDGAVRAVGAGLLSSCGELESFRRAATLVDWDLERMSRTPYDPTSFQPLVFVAPSWSAMLSSLEAWPALER